MRQLVIPMLLTFLRHVLLGPIVSSEMMRSNLENNCINACRCSVCTTRVRLASFRNILVTTRGNQIPGWHVRTGLVQQVGILAIYNDNISRNPPVHAYARITGALH